LTLKEPNSFAVKTLSDKNQLIKTRSHIREGQMVNKEPNHLLTTDD